MSDFNFDDLVSANRSIIELIKIKMTYELELNNVDFYQRRFFLSSF